MKKVLTICIALLYTLITSGFTVNLHYCMGVLAAVELHDDSHEDEGCGYCGMKKKGDCCQDEAKFLKMESDHQAAKVFFSQDVFGAVTLPVIFLSPAPVALHNALQVWAPKHAPPDSDVPLYTRHCVFLI